jgi:alpha-L-rhamnosidase
MNLFLKKHLNKYLAFLMLFLISKQAYSASPVKPTGLECEHLPNPIGVDAPKPRLSWLMTDERQDAKQTAYRIYIGQDSTEVNSKKGNTWDNYIFKQSDQL